jgi:hypothetical protein
LLFAEGVPRTVKLCSPPGLCAMSEFIAHNLNQPDEQLEQTHQSVNQQFNPEGIPALIQFIDEKKRKS